jgi:hypothetical protein
VLHGTAGAVVGTSWAISGGGVAVLIAIVIAAVALPAMWRYRAATAA